MLVTFMRCEWRGGSRRLIKAAGMLIGGGHCCPLCSAASDWASVVPVKGQGTDLKSVTLTPHTLQHPPPPPHTYVHRLSHLCPTPTHLNHPLPFFTFGLFQKKMEPFLLLSFPSTLPNQVFGSHLPAGALHHLWSVWPLQLCPGQEEDKLVVLVCVFFKLSVKKILSGKVN